MSVLLLLRPGAAASETNLSDFLSGETADLTDLGFSSVLLLLRPEVDDATSAKSKAKTRGNDRGNDDDESKTRFSGGAAAAPAKVGQGAAACSLRPRGSRGGQQRGDMKTHDGKQ